MVIRESRTDIALQDLVGNEILPREIAYRRRVRRSAHIGLRQDDPLVCCQFRGLATPQQEEAGSRPQEPSFILRHHLLPHN